MTHYNGRLDWLKSADREFADMGAPAVDLTRAELYWDEASEILTELVLDEYGNEFSEDVLFARVTLYDIALFALALAAQERDDGWYDVVLQKFLERYERRIERVREQRTLPNIVGLSIRGWESDADPGL
jgi:hypothetical protein